MGLSSTLVARRLELLQQTVDVVELLLGTIGFARTPAQLFEDFASTREIGLIGDPDRTTGHRSLLLDRTAERIELLAAGLLAFAGLLALLLRHHVLRELLSAVAQLIERTLLALTGASELAV